LEIR